MTTATEPRATRYAVRRWSRLSRLAMTAIGLAVVAMALVPMVLSTYATEQLTELLLLAILAAMWNALAGYGGLVSIGQQAFIGLGAYATIVLTQRGVPPYPAMVIAALITGLVALPVSLLALRLRGGQFAIGTWVVAEVVALLIALVPSVGGGTGVSLTGLNVYPPADRQAYTYWLTLAFGAGLFGVMFALLRSPIGAALQAIRDDEAAAASLGVRVDAGKRLLFVLASFGCGAAGALTLANTLFIQPQSIFGVQWTAYMIFMVLVGGIGTFEGPMIGAIAFFAIQHWFADQGAWYLIGLGITAVGFALLFPLGIWGWLEQRLHLRLFPLGYRLERQDRPEVPR
ncbi:MAG TPA: branched-chain amino acid ABC transporter permease [Kofleriaceae bacterium]